jgi:hypothetical protein
LLDNYSGAKPKTLESKLANDPDFFCEIIRLLFRSDKKDEIEREHTEESKAVVNNAWRLLYKWKTIPGMQSNGQFVAAKFSEWIQRVKTISSESGHFEMALLTIGKALIYSPADPDGLWIHRAIA